LDDEVKSKNNHVYKKGEIHFSEKSYIFYYFSGLGAGLMLGIVVKNIC